MSKIALIAASLILCLGIVVGSFRFAERTIETDAQPAFNAIAYEAYSVGINTVLYDIDGQINYTLRADRQTQFFDDTTVLENPFIRLYQQGLPTWNVVAETGTIQKPQTLEEQDSRSMLLEGNVEVYTINEFGNRTVITTASLDVNFDKEQLLTADPVLVETEVLSQTSIGMFANLATDEIVFHQDVQGTYEPETSN
jgi:LPS export ABC transporter protein LptC